MLVRKYLRISSMIPKQCHSCNRKYHYDGWYHPPPQKGNEPIRQNTTALVLGWAGSQPKYVQVYSKLFAEEFGIGAHGYTLPMELIFGYDQDTQRKLAEETIEVIAKENTGKNIIVHCFSNNGFNFYKHVSQLLKAKPQGLNLLGCIIDSAPGPLSLTPYHAQKLGLKTWKGWGIPKGPPILKLPGVYGYFQMTELKRSLPVALWKALQIAPTSMKNWYKYGSEEWAGLYLLHKEKENWPLLFLYSKKDDLMAWTWVRDVVKAKQQQNPERLIREKLFEDSPHVAHLRVYPEEYKRLVKDFVQDCLPYTLSKL